MTASQQLMTLIHFGAKDEGRFYNIAYSERSHVSRQNHESSFAVDMQLNWGRILHTVMPILDDLNVKGQKLKMYSHLFITLYSSATKPSQSQALVHDFK